MIKIEKNQVYSTNGKTIHRIGSDIYFKRGSVLKGDTVGDFEEVDAVPPFTRDEYSAKVPELIRERYSESQEFEVLHDMINALVPAQADLSEPADAAAAKAEKALANYRDYDAFVAQCKRRAVEILSDPAARNERSPDE